MKKIILLIAVFGGLTGPIKAQEAYQSPQLEKAQSWTLIMVPDIQNYVKWKRNQGIMDIMMSWIETHIDSLNIKMVVCTGDLVENNEKITNDYDGDQTTDQQWAFAANSFARLNGKVPYIAAAGNHDYSTDAKGNRSSRYSEFFKPETNYLNQQYLVQNTRNEQGKPTIENAAYELKNLNGKDYLFMTVEYGARDTVLNWAEKVAGLAQYKDHRTILLTHNYISNKDEHTTSAIKWLYWEPYNIDNQIQKGPRVTIPHANNGAQIWQKLVQPSSNIEMVLCGHISGEGYRKDKNQAGKTVHQILFDAQSEGGGHRYGNGGDGWIRILEFFPDNKTVKVSTFSPLFGISPSTRHLAWRKDARNEYTLSFD
ncbi:metallophosphoesterase [Niabella terrae]